MLLDFLPLVKLKRGVFNYITKRRRNGLSLMINRIMFMKKPDLVSFKPSPNLADENP
jgi:hypothetical protein